ncbi:hypothetical protein LTR16_010587, partial [Cryomyces antarcticus]
EKNRSRPVRLVAPWNGDQTLRQSCLDGSEEWMIWGMKTRTMQKTKRVALHSAKQNSKNTQLRPSPQMEEEPWAMFSRFHNGSRC